jgi:uroporphyrinogen decarboxylase
MDLRKIPARYKEPPIDPIQQIVVPEEETLKKIGSDTRRIGAHRIPEYDKNLKIVDGVEQVKDFYGCEWRRNPQKDLYFNQVSFPLEKYTTLSECTSRIESTDWEQYINVLNQDLDRQFKAIRGYCCVADRHTAGLTENSLRIRGYEKWYMDTIVDVKGVESLLDIILEDKIRYWDALVAWANDNNCLDQIDVASECDDLGAQSSTIIDPGDLRKLVIPRLKILFRHIKSRIPGVKIFMHSCGAIRELIPDLIEAGVEILNPVQYTAAGMNLAGLKKDFGNDLVFWGGGIDTQSMLNCGKPDKILEVVKENLDIMAPGGGFVFAPVHNIQDDVPAENFWAMWDALQEYGKY